VRLPLITPATNAAYDGRSRPPAGEDAVVREPHSTGRGCRFHIIGNLTDHNARFLRQRVLDELHEGQRTIVVDLTRAHSFDTGALGILVSLTRRVQEAQGTFELDNVPESVRVSFELLRLDQVFVIREPQARGFPRRTPASSSVIPMKPRV
jgi:anti-anti-sigma factor